VRGAVPTALFQISSAARRVFDTSADPARTTVAFRSDPLLGPLITRRPGLRIPGAWDPFECTVCAVLGQKVSIASSRTLAARIVERAGQRVKETVAGLTHLFPTPTAFAKADLNGLGLSTTCLAALHELAQAVIQGRLDFGAPIETVVAALSILPGVGSSTAEYVALHGLGEPDAFPATDSVFRYIARICKRPLSALELEARAEAWRPWRGYAALHLWSAAANRIECNTKGEMREPFSRKRA
jgi:AraC family transcriptional regulator of adaptative response / DNA-3-methyladenine glycosylase II